MVTREIIRELSLKDFIIFLLQSDYNFEVKKENEITVIIIYNIYEVHYYDDKVDWIIKHEV